MFEEEGFSLSPTNFFQIHGNCNQIKGSFPQLSKMKGDQYKLPDTEFLTNDDLFATVFMGWNTHGIEVLCRVEVPLKESNNKEITARDSVELFFDTRDIKTSGFNTKFCHHFFFLHEAMEGQFAGEITKFRTEDRHELCDPHDLVTKTKKLADGYTLEIFIPAHCLHGYDPAQFNRLGFTYRINRVSGEPQHFSVITNEYQIEQQPSLWSSLKLQAL